MGGPSDRPLVTVDLDPEHHRGEVDRRMFGSFVEHMGRCVYTGIYEPGHPTANPDGFRRDVADLVRELGVTLVRYPGGNFVSGYDWRDGIGPRDQRPRRLDLAWRSIETNQVGTDELLGWARGLGLEPMMAVNLGTAGVREAAALVEYCNLPGGTAWSDLRRRHGSETPYDVRLWCLGNEMDGPWQTGHVSAARYGDLAAEAAKAMRLVDPTVELVLCGSSDHAMPSFGYWENEVLERAGDHVDHLSMHAYYEEVDGDRASFLASGADMDAYIDEVVATLDAVAARRRRRDRPIHISFDEWNVWYRSRAPDTHDLPIDVSGPRIEDVYSDLDAVVVGDLLATLVNHADRVRIACQAQLVNVIAPIMTDPGGAAWRQTTYLPFATTAATARGNSLVTRLRGPELTTRRYGDVPAVAAAATHDPATGEVALFLTNRGDRPADVELRHRGFQGWRTHRVQTIAADGTGAPSRAGVRDAARLILPPQSWTHVGVSTAGSGGG